MPTRSPRRIIRASTNNEATVLRKTEQIVNTLDGWGVGNNAKEGANPKGGVPRSALVTNPAYTDAIVMLKKGGNTFGSGAFVRLWDANLRVEIPCIITCAHCLSSSTPVEVIFDHNARANAKMVRTKTVPRTFFLVVEATPDVCVCAIQAFHGLETRATVRLAVPKGDKKIIVLQHPVASQVAVGNGRMGLVDRDTILHTSNTLPGSSGSPIMYMDGDDGVSMCGVHCEAIDLQLNSRTSVPVNMGYTLTATLTWLYRNSYTIR